MQIFKLKNGQFPVMGILIAIGILVLLPQAANTVLSLFIRPQNNTIAPLFTPEVQYWSDDIERWSTANGIDPNLMATIMQIESCGHPTVASHAGAQGLFQVMPFHFDDGENMLDPNTNAQRSANFIRECSGYANGDAGLIMACYNGGPSVVRRNFNTWPNETQRYYIWGLGIYYDAVVFSETSQTLNEWLRAGGQSLCTRAAAEQHFN